MQHEGVTAEGQAAAYDAQPWLDQYPPDVPRSIPPAAESIWDALEATTRQYGSNTAFLFQNYPLSFRRLRDLSAGMAGALTAHGVGKGDIVLLLLPNVPHFALAYYGTVRLGAAVAAVSPTSVERELEFFLQDSGAKTIVTLDLLYEKIANIWERCGVEQVIVGKVTDFMPRYVQLAAPYLKRVPKPKQPVPYGGRVQPLRSFLRGGKNVKVEVQVEPDDVALLQYTGGTTGTPKAAMLTHRGLLTNAHQMVAWFPTLRRGQETILAVLPFFHVYGVTLALNAGLLLAARTILIAGGWSPSEIFDAIKRYRPNIFPGVPTLYVAMVNDERSRSYDISSIDICVSGGAPLPIEVKRDFERLSGGHLYEGYGLSEASPVVAAQPFDESGKLGSIGLPMPDTRLRLVDENDQPVPVGEDGELVVQGPQVMQGYWRRLEETAAVLRGGWLHTGDIARMDSDGYLYIVDRKKDLIITGGENIYPREVEEVLFEHPKVKEVAVVGVPHPFGGEIAKAFVVLKEGETATKKDITQFAGERLAKHKVPRAVEFRETLPKSAAGKVLRRVLAEEERQRRPARTRSRANKATSPDSGA